MVIRALAPDGCRHLLDIVLREDGTVLVNGRIVGTKDKLFQNLGWKRRYVDYVLAIT